MRYVLLAAVLGLGVLTSASRGAEFNIRNYGAVADDETDDTPGILAALEACHSVGGGTVFVPAGTYLVARQKAETPILPLPSNTTLRGEGTASVLKFAQNVSNFWRMIGAREGGCRNVTVRDLRLDGSSTFTDYKPGTTPEHNHGIFFSSDKEPIENVVIRDLLVENFSGDCVGIGQGCRNVTIRDVKLKNFIRQGIQLAGGNGARDYLVTGVQDLEHTVEPGGSTIHVEHARGLQNVTIAGNHCRNSLLAGGVDGLIIRDNIVTGQIAGNGNAQAVVQGNIVRGTAKKQFAIQLGYSDGLTLSGNHLLLAGEGQGGIYVWGTSRYNPAPSRHVVISGNSVRKMDDTPAGKGVFLNGVEDAVVRGNLLAGKMSVVSQRARQVHIELADAAQPEAGQ